MSMPLTKKELDNYWNILQSNLTNLKLDIDFPYKTIYEEIEPFLDNFVVHRANYSNGGWKSLTLHGTDVTVTTSKASTHFNWTTMADICPETKYYFDKVWPQPKHRRVRWMLLEPGGSINPHTDSEDNLLGDAVNFCITQPNNCDFTIGGEVIPWKPGDVRLLNLSHTHEVHNKSNERRLHMIYHGKDTRCGRLSNYNKHIGKTYEDGDFTPLWVRLVNKSFQKYG